MPKLTSKNSRKIFFDKSRLRESTEDFNNPDRGWYQIHSFVLGSPIVMTDREYTLNNTDSIAFVLIDISAYRDRPLDGVAVAGIRKIFDFFRDYRLGMVVRVVYDTIGNCLATEPDSEETIIGHLNMLVKIMEDYKADIFVYQGLLIGNWGEMHSSKFLSPARLKKLSEGLLETINDTAYLAVRRPAYVRIIFPEGEDIRQKKVGIYDDAILASPTHLGTFGDKPAKEVRREHSWLPMEEISYVSELCDRVPYGGEALWSDETDSLSKVRSSLKEMSDYFATLHVTYLNRIHDAKFIDHLKEMKYDGRGIYRGMDGFSYMSRHLGYRFVLRNVRVSIVESADEQLRWDITVENIGFARAFFKSGCIMEADDMFGNRTAFDVSDWFELNQVPSRSKHTFICMTPFMSGHVYLSFTKALTRETIFFANELKGKTGPRLYLGRLSIR